MDITCCPIGKPCSEKEQFYCHKCRRYVWKYSICINPITGKIVDVFGPAPGGLMDWQILVEYLPPKCTENERILCDKIFAGRHMLFETPHLGREENLTPHQRIFNNTHSRFHWEQIERMNRRIHGWLCTKRKFRGGTPHGPKEKLKHHKMVHVACNLVNLDLIENPLNAE